MLEADLRNAVTGLPRLDLAGTALRVARLSGRELVRQDIFCARPPLFYRCFRCSFHTGDYTTLFQAASSPVRQPDTSLGSRPMSARRCNVTAQYFGSISMP